MTQILPMGLKANLPFIFESHNLSFEGLLQDGSTRKYIRVYDQTHQQSYILMLLKDDDAEKLRQGEYDWLTIAKFFEKEGIPYPKVIKELPDYEAIILTDLGSVDLARQIASKPSIIDCMSYFEQAFHIISKFLQFKPSTRDIWSMRAFTPQKFTQELEFFLTYFIQKTLNKTLSEHDLHLFRTQAESLSDYLASLSIYFVHRDFHSRNLMINDRKVWVLDFQDARLGPPAYDLVSLCFDSYINCEMHERFRLFDFALATLERNCPHKIIDQINATWPAMLLQRQLKALGSFGFLTLSQPRDYLVHVPYAIKTLDHEAIHSLKEWSFLVQLILDSSHIY